MNHSTPTPGNVKYRSTADFLAQNPGYWGDDIDGDPLRPTPEEVAEMYAEMMFADALDNPEGSYEEPDGLANGPVEMADDNEPPF
jgi:hypothetical protein